MPAFVRTSIFITLCCICSSAFAQQSVFGWIDNKTNLHWRIDTSSHILKQEIKPDQWNDAAQVKMADGTFRELPANFSTNSFLSKDSDKLYFTVPGTGQVYQFNKSTCTLIRLDKTYYRGYNFGSCQFMRKDTIYSFGGSGFWQFNSSLTYYDWDHQEWEWFHSKKDGPQVITSDFNGYDAKKDVFYSALNPDNREYGQRKTTGDTRVFALNLKDKNWQLLGSIDNQDIYNPDEPVIWSGRYFFQCNDNFLLIVDPEQNRVLKYNDGKSIFTSIINIDNKTLLVRYGKFNSKYVRESFAIENILREAKYFGPFYIDHTISWQTYCELGFGILAVVSLIGYSVRRRKSDFVLTNSKGSSLDLTNSERTVLTVLVSNGRNGALSALQLNSILNIDDKSQDNQRKIRNNFIAEINRKIELKYRIANGVGRKPLDEDKRLTLYYLQEEAFDLFSKLIPA